MHPIYCDIYFVLSSAFDILRYILSCQAIAIYDLPINLRYIYKRVSPLVFSRVTPALRFQPIRAQLKAHLTNSNAGWFFTGASVWGRTALSFLVCHIRWWKWPLRTICNPCDQRKLPDFWGIFSSQQPPLPLKHCTVGQNNSESESGHLWDFSDSKHNSTVLLVPITLSWTQLPSTKYTT